MQTMNIDQDIHVLYPKVDVYGNPLYDRSYPVPKWHQHLELATICAALGLSLLIITTRLIVRIHRMNQYKGDDRWIIAAGVFLVFPLMVSQIGANVYGSGLYWKNIPESWRKKLWQFGWGYFAYFVVTSLIKISTCFTLLQLVSYERPRLRSIIYTLCCLVFSLAIVGSSLWLFACVPFKSNFVYETRTATCLDLEVPQYCWFAISIAFNFVILYIPFEVVRENLLARQEKKVLLWLFLGYLLGTVTCIVGTLCMWTDRWGIKDDDSTYTQSIFIMLNDLEILFYTIGACFPVIAPIFMSSSSSLRSGSPTTLTSLSVESIKDMKSPITITTTYIDSPYIPPAEYIEESPTYPEHTFETATRIGTAHSTDEMLEQQYFETIELGNAIIVDATDKDKLDPNGGVRHAKALSVQRFGGGASNRTTWIEITRAPSVVAGIYRAPSPSRSVREVEEAVVFNRI